MLGCASDGTGSDMGQQFGNGLSKLGHATTQVVGGAGHGLANAGSSGFNGTGSFINGNNNYGAANNNYGANNYGTGRQQKLNEGLTLLSKFADLADLDNPQRQDQLGQAMAVAIMNRYPPSNDQQANDYVNLVGMTMASVSPRPDLNYTFQVLESDEIGAYSTPGGYVFITRGALKMASDESELAGVLAHEVAHVALNHGIEAVKNAKFNDLVITAGEMRSKQLRQFEAVTQGAAEHVLDDLHSQDQEYAADNEAVKYLIVAGYDPNGFLHYLQKLQAKIGAGGGLGGIMKTHPGTADRIGKVQQLIAASGVHGGVTAPERFAQYVH
jgi:predicted Zn-dependent protease